MPVDPADGLVVREVGQWTLDKLYFVERYAKAFVVAMTPKKWEALVYLDLLAGPGRCVQRETGDIHLGSPLRALAVEPKFSHLFFVEEDGDNFDALTRRVRPEDQGRVDVRRGDCNVLVHDVVARISPGALGLAFVDPQGCEVRFDTLRVLAGRRLDIFYLFPSGIDIARNIQEYSRRSSSPLDEMLGGREWRTRLKSVLEPHVELTESGGRGIIRECLDVFREKMRGLGYEHFDEGEPAFSNDRNVRMYHLLFFSKHKAGVKIWHEVKKKGPTGQRELDFGGGM